MLGGTFMKRFTEFFSGVAREMQKVSWPKRKELTKYTIVVVTTVLFMAFSLQWSIWAFPN